MPPTVPRLLIAALLVMGAFPAAAGTIAGRASVIDADTLEIHGERIRILDIDAPERRQTCTAGDGTEWRCGQQAAIRLSDWIDGRLATCETTKKDRYGRWLANCTVNGRDIARWMAELGWAVPYRDCRCIGIRDAADRAKKARLGIWSGAFMMPWKWRKAN